MVGEGRTGGGEGEEGGREKEGGRMGGEGPPPSSPLFFLCPDASELTRPHQRANRRCIAVSEPGRKVKRRAAAAAIAAAAPRVWVRLRIFAPSVCSEGSCARAG